MSVDAEAATVGETQSAFSALPDGAVFPAGHAVQVSDDLAPNADENVSSGHVVHVASDSAPHEDENLPTPHFVQSEAPDPANFPASQSEHAVADKRDAAYFPAPHVTQSASASLPVVGKNLPAQRQISDTE